ncbi:MAG: ATP-binding protein [Spirochaetaceae bacterium]|jgi:hypothetical protein|nr:ATP-binding protein [Spirochaetaceae bacterium]
MAQTQRKMKFNTTGPCNPDRHYMVDISGKLKTIVEDYIEPGEYFVINRGRQYGKTTTIKMLKRRLKDNYIVFDLSFEGVGDDMFKDEYSFYEGLRLLFLDKLAEQAPKYTRFFKKPLLKEYTSMHFRKSIEKLCGTSPKPVILFIDEIDKSPDFDVFFNFLGLLRDKFIQRSDEGTPTFQSVIFAGVTDIRNLKSRIRPESEHTVRSPKQHSLLSNIAVPFNVDMRFAPKEIVTMLADYEADYQTGMDQMAIAERIYYYTSGYPFMVSAICKEINEKGKTWDIDSVDETVKNFVSANNTLFGSLESNLERYSEFADFARNMVLDGLSVPYMSGNESIERGLVLNILKVEGSKVVVSNKIYETRIANYFIAQMLTKPKLFSDTNSEAQSRFIENGELNMKFILQRFNVFMKSEYRDSDTKFIEREARLIFLAFLKPIINGQGNYAIEPETRNFQRMDIVIFFQGKEYVLELKIWHGEKHNDNAIGQLIEYLKTRDTKEGYLLSFASNKSSPKESQVIEQDGYTIYEEVVAYNEDE